MISIQQLTPNHLWKWTTSNRVYKTINWWLNINTNWMQCIWQFKSVSWRHIKHLLHISKVGDIQGPANIHMSCPHCVMGSCSVRHPRIYFLFFTGCKQIQHFSIIALLQRGLLHNTCSVKDKIFTPHSPKSHEIEMRVMNKRLRHFMVTVCDPLYLDSAAANVRHFSSTCFCLNALFRTF